MDAEPSWHNPLRRRFCQGEFLLGRISAYVTTNSVAIFVGIDGGGTKTTCLVGDEERVLAAASSVGSNPIRVGEEQSRKALQAVVRNACAAAKVDLASVSRTCIGLAGGARPEVAGRVGSIVAEYLAGEIVVVGDMVIALEAAFEGKPGVIVVAGTGSIAYGRNQRGQTARAGGWGYVISDEGSGHWIGREAISAAMRAHDTGESALLVSSIMNSWHLGTRDDVVRTANAIPPPDFSSLFPPVLAAAASGDPLARTVLTRAGSELAELAKIVIGRLWQLDQSFGVAMAGGVFQNAPIVRQVFANSLHSEYPRAILNPTVVHPEHGALFLARQARRESTSTAS